MVYEYIVPVLKRGYMILSAKNASRDVALEIVYRANEVYRYDYTSLSIAKPQEMCSEINIPDKVCKTLPSGK